MCSAVGTVFSGAFYLYCPQDRGCFFFNLKIANTNVTAMNEGSRIQIGNSGRLSEGAKVALGDGDEARVKDFGEETSEFS